MINSHDMPQTYTLLQHADAWAASTAAAATATTATAATATATATTTSPPARSTFVASATTPTVTMPRIKALMSGVNPSFVDVFRNFDSTKFERDNLLRQLHRRGDRCVLLGDDTWLKLFPQEFNTQLSDPTHSFFAQDTTEVDNNVTRHVSEFLDPLGQHARSQSWDVLVMHYLGLDHVGHMRGPNSQLMKLKQQEMDQMIAKISASIAQQDGILRTSTLLVVLSDHGMTESGNHGGASTVEKDAVLALFPPKVVQETQEKQDQQGQHKGTDRRGAFDNAPRVSQLDLVPTIATALNVPIPVDNQGVVLTSFLKTFMDPTTYEHALNRNIQQIWRKMHQDMDGQRDPAENALVTLYNDLQALPSTTRPHLHIEMSEEFIQTYAQLRKNTSTSFSSSSSTVCMMVGLMLLVLGAGLLLHGLHQLYRAYVDATRTTKSTLLLRFEPWYMDECLIWVIFLFNALTLTSSSFIENEHAVWYTLGTTWYVLRIVRTWGETRSKGRSTVSWRLPVQMTCAGSSLLLLRCMRSRNSIINFSKLNQLLDANNTRIETKLISSTAVVMVAPIEHEHHIVPVLVYICLAMLVSIGCLLYQWRTPLSSSSLSSLSFLFTLLSMGMGYSSIVVHTCFKANVFQSYITPFMDQWSIVMCPLAAFCLLVLSAIASSHPSPRRRSSETQQQHNTSSPSTTMLLVGILFIAMLLHRPQKILPLVEMFVVVVALPSVLQPLQDKPTRHLFVPNILMYICIGQCCFFSMGNSHTMGTADFAGAYTGATHFSKYTTGCLAVFMVFTGPCIAYIGACTHVLNALSLVQPVDGASKSTMVLVQSMFSMLVLYRCLMMVVSMVVTWVFQHHLFVWSVFAPKFIYEIGQTCVLFVVYMCYTVWCMVVQGCLGRQMGYNWSRGGLKKIV